jgi:hypothetical protein
MKHTLSFLAFLCLSLSSFAQDLEGWHIGATVQPYNYWLYNRYDIEEAVPPNTKGIGVDLTFINPKLGIPNGFAGGITATKFYKPQFGLKAELTYSTQKQQYDYFIGSTSVVYDNYTKLDYLKLPVMAMFILLPEQNNNIYLSTGLQLSYLTNFVKTSTYRNLVDGSFYTNYESKRFKDIRYKELQFGGIAEIGYLHTFSDTWNLHLGIRGEYDFTNAKNFSAKAIKLNYWQDAFRGSGSDKNTVPSHNIRLGLNITLTYKLN